MMMNNNNANKQKDYAIIHARNFLTLFVTIAFLLYVHFQMNEVKADLINKNNIISSLLRNESYSIEQKQLALIQKSLEESKYDELSQGECLLKIYFAVLKNQQFQALSATGAQTEKSTKLQISSDKSSSLSSKFLALLWSSSLKQLSFPSLTLPTTDHDLLNLSNCSDIISLVNYLNPSKADFIYTNFMQEKYGSFQHKQDESLSIKSNEETKDSRVTELAKAHNNYNFCIINNQFNTSLTKLRKNINSLIDQSYENYKLIVLDNGSKDGSYEIAKIIIQDHKQKIVKEGTLTQALAEQKYQIIKEQSHLSEWNLYLKHTSLCENSDYILFVDGRDELVSRHVLSILNSQLNKSTIKPDLITGSILISDKLSKMKAPQTYFSAQYLPSYTFKALSWNFFKESKQAVSTYVSKLTNPFQINFMISQFLFKQATSKQSILAIDEILYAYDPISIDRNEYLIANQRKQLLKTKPKQK